MNDRNKKYFSLNSKLASLNDSQIKDILDDNLVGQGWGKNYVVKVGGIKSFVKTISLTEKELKNQFSTKNHYNLPLFYNYGVGSAGMGAFRELNTHIKTTNWVLSGEHKSFPLMYHFRVIKKDKIKKKLKKSEEVNHQNYINYWNGSKKIDQYIRDRKLSEYELVIFLEFIPHVFFNWIKPNISKIDSISKKVIKSIDFLKSKGLIHFDLHHGNILTDGNEVYLTDFGLALDKGYDLKANEIKFYKDHRNYDYMEYIGCNSTLLESFWHDLSDKAKANIEKKYSINLETPFYEKVEVILKNLEDIDKEMKLQKSYKNYLLKNRELMLYSNSFFYGLRKDSKKRSTYNDRVVSKLKR